MANSERSAAVHDLCVHCSVLRTDRGGQHRLPADLSEIKEASSVQERSNAAGRTQGEAQGAYASYELVPGQHCPHLWHKLATVEHTEHLHGSLCSVRQTVSL